jgi:hypothetical protein
MEPITGIATSLAGKAGESAIEVGQKGAEGFLAKVIGPSAEAIGELFALRLKERLHGNLINVALRASKKLQNAGVDPRQVPLKIIHPLLEAASLEEDDDIRERWANLLANAADSGNKSRTVQPSFVAILKELTPREVKFLDALYEAARIPVNGKLAIVVDVRLEGYSERQLLRVYGVNGPFHDSSLPGSPVIVDWKERAQEAQAYMDEFNELISLLVRNGVLSKSNVPRPLKVDIVDGGGFGVVASASSTIDIDVETIYLVTHLGWNFIEACRGPETAARG